MSWEAVDVRRTQIDADFPNQHIIDLKRNNIKKNQILSQAKFLSVISLQTDHPHSNPEKLTACTEWLTLFTEAMQAKGTQVSEVLKAFMITMPITENNYVKCTFRVRNQTDE